MKIAIEGCAHGELDEIYEAITLLERGENIKIDLLICCGDFQATRNLRDLKCMAVPAKYQSMCSFYKYYSGEKVAPVLTLFIGGNHEATNYLQELAYGGWAAPNIYYMGYANVVNVAGIRIAGLSGIYKGHDYMKGHYEKPPYSEETKRSAYHIRSLEIFRLKQLKQPIDIFLSHDWPRGVHRYGNEQRLLKQKPFFKSDIEADILGSKPSADLLHHLKPSYWFAAHLHVRFAAIVPHASSSSNENKRTRFLALDKCLPKRKFLQVIDIPHDTKKSVELEYDVEWLTILQLTNHLLSIKKNFQYMPGPGSNERWNFTPTEDELDSTCEKFENNFHIPKNFTRTVDPYSASDSEVSRSVSQPSAQVNPQTIVFCEQLGINDPMAMLLNCSDGSSSFNNSSASIGTLPSFLTPERPGDVSHVSFSMNESTDYDDAESAELESISSITKESVSLLPMRRLSLALPSPQNSDVDEPLGKAVNEDCSETPKSSETGSLGAYLLSPKDSDAEDLNSTFNDDTSLEISAIDKSETGTQNVKRISEHEDQPQPKKFKRRNQALYSSTDEDC